MRKGMWKENAKRLSSILLAGMILTTTVAPPVFAVHTYYWPDAISADAMEIHGRQKERRQHWLHRSG